MTTFWHAPAIAIVFTWLATPPGSLGQAGRREAVRRALVSRAVATLSLYELPLLQPVAPPSSPAPRSATPAVPASADPEVPAPPRPPPGEERRDEQWWRERMAAARAALARDQTLADAMQSHVNSLRTDVANRDDPAQQAALRQRLTTALVELDRLTRQIEADRQAITAIEEEARRLGVPAGWIRDQEAARRLEIRVAYSCARPLRAPRGRPLGPP